MQVTSHVPISSAPSLSPRPLAPLPTAWAEADQSSQLRAQPFGSGTVGDAMDQAIVFAVEGRGSMSSRSLVPQTRAAADLVQRPEGQRIERMLTGALSMFDGREGANSIRSISLGSTPETFALAATFGSTELKGFADADIPQVMQYLEASLPFPDHGILAHAGAVTNIGPVITGEMMALAQTDVPIPEPVRGAASHLVATTLVHELEHNITHATPRQGMRDEAVDDPDLTIDDAFGALRPAQWLEEASVNTLSEWPGRVEEAARRMGLPAPIAPTDEANRIYPHQTDAMRRLLPLAGIDPAAPGDFDRVAALLQGAGLLQTADRIASAIARTQGLDDSARTQVRDLIRVAGNRHQIEPEAIPPRIDEIEAFVREAAGAVRRAAA